MKQRIAFARHLHPDRSEPAEQEAHLQPPSVPRLAIDPEGRQQAARRELQAVVDPRIERPFVAPRTRRPGGPLMHPANVAD